MTLGKQNRKYCIARHTPNKQHVIGLYNIEKKTGDAKAYLKDKTETNSNKKGEK